MHIVAEGFNFNQIYQGFGDVLIEKQVKDLTVYLLTLK
jgi:acyl CoA:acetate/3-ketoacid CoA transferase alpha subunit